MLSILLDAGSAALGAFAGAVDWSKVAGAVVGAVIGSIF